MNRWRFLKPRLHPSLWNLIAIAQHQVKLHTRLPIALASTLLNDKRVYNLCRRSLDRMISSDARLQLHQPLPREIAIMHDETWEKTASGYHDIFKNGDCYRLPQSMHIDFPDSELRTDSHPRFCRHAESSDGIAFGLFAVSVRSQRLKSQQHRPDQRSHEWSGY